MTSEQHRSPLYRVLLTLLLLLLVAVLLLRACAVGASFEEVERVASPDGAVDAVLTSDSGFGATVGPISRLLITPAGESPREGDVVLYAENLGKQGLDLRWRDERSLEIRYADYGRYGEGARISNFTNEESITNEQGESFKVRSRLVPLEEES